MLKVNPAKLLDVRILLEINTLQNAVDRITDEQLQHLAEKVARMKFLAKQGRPFVEADREFHATLFSCTGNEFLEDLLTSFWDLYEMSVTDKHHQDLVLIAESHEGVMAAVARHDVDTAKAIVDGTVHGCALSHQHRFGKAENGRKPQRTAAGEQLRIISVWEEVQ